MTTISKQYKKGLPNALKAYLIIEVPTKDMPADQALQLVSQVYKYVRNEIGGEDNDDSLVVLVFHSDKINIELLNSPYDAWEKYEDTLSQRFENIEEFIKSIYENSSCS